ncbi:hypothetical protein ACFC58_29250, partial [Kitasatospora purpeofusca]|uniref:hypothetical protein n=1 Tax=Kitasatospora purpeofusca TaxID=67352 RepID=UPI0035E11300
TSRPAAVPPSEARAAGTSATVEPVVRITIDRVEVRAAPLRPAAPRPPARQPRLGLDEYLQGRS